MKPRLSFGLWILAFLAAYGVVFLYWITSEPVGRIPGAEAAPTRENFLRVHKGMKFMDVVAILGPSDFMRANQNEHDVVMILAGSIPGSTWSTEHFKIKIDFCQSGATDDDLAWRGALIPAEGEPIDRRPSPRQGLRRWLPWLE
jgi:hypothetical protein